MKYKENQRVELHPATDQWMMGARFGKIVIVNEEEQNYLVKLDRLHIPIRVKEEDLVDV